LSYCIHYHKQSA